MIAISGRWFQDISSTNHQPDFQTSRLVDPQSWRVDLVYVFSQKESVDDGFEQRPLKSLISLQDDLRSADSRLPDLLKLLNA